MQRIFDLTTTLLAERINSRVHPTAFTYNAREHWELRYRYGKVESYFVPSRYITKEGKFNGKDI